MFPKKKSAREERRAKERKESKVARAELKEKARKEELQRERQEALRKLEAVKERTLKQTAIRKAFEERQGDPGATSGITSYSDSATAQYNIKGYGKAANISLTLTSGQ